MVIEAFVNSSQVMMGPGAMNGAMHVPYPLTKRKIGEGEWHCLKLNLTSMCCTPPKRLGDED